MNNKWIEYGQDILIMVMNHLLLTVAAVCVGGLFGEEAPQFGLWAAAFILPVGFYVIRALVRYLVPFLLLHLLFPASVLLLPIGGRLKVIALAMALIYAMLSMKIRYREDDELDHLMSPMGTIGLIGAVSLIDYLAKNGWEQYYLAIAILYVGLYFTSYFLGQYLFMRVVNQSSVGVIPERAIFSTGARQTVLFSLGSMAVLLLTANIGWVSYILSWIWKGLYAVLAVLVDWIPKGDGSGAEEEMLGANTAGPMLPNIGDDNSLLNKIMQFLDKLVGVVIVVAVAVIVVIAVKKVIKYLRDNFTQSGRKKGPEWEEGQDIRENCAIEKTERETAGLFSYFSNRERIRRIFRKKVLKNKDSIVGKHDVGALGCLTSSECCSKLPEEKDASDVLKNMYDKARYSPEEITAEDVRRVKVAKAR